MKKIDTAKLLRTMKMTTLWAIFVFLVTLSGTLVYLGVVLLLVLYHMKDTGGYPPFVLAAISAAMGALVFSVARFDEAVKDSKSELVNVGELYALAAMAFTALGIFYPIVEQMSTPYSAFCIPFILVLLSLVTASISLVFASSYFIRTLSKKGRILFRGRG